MSRPRRSTASQPPPRHQDIEVGDVLLVRRMTYPFETPMFGWVDMDPLWMVLPVIGFQKARSRQGKVEPFRRVPIRPDWRVLARYRGGVRVASVVSAPRDLNPSPPDALPADWLTYSTEQVYRRLVRLKPTLARFWMHGWRIDWSTGDWSWVSAKKNLDIRAVVRYTADEDGWSGVVLDHVGRIAHHRHHADEFRAVALTHQAVVASNTTAARVSG